MSGKINLVLVGAGGIGKRWARALLKSKQVKVVAVVDSDLARASVLAQTFKSCRVESDWKSALKKSDVAAALVATPHNLLAPISAFALKNNKHVLCEKPGAIAASDLKKNLLLAKKNHLQYLIGFNHRFHPAFMLARSLWEQGKIGKIQFIRARYAFGGREGFNKEWRMNKTIAGGGELIDQGVHMIDLIRSFIGEISVAHGLVGNLFWSGSVEDNAFVILKSKTKQLASIHVSWSNWKPVHNFEIYGEKGYISIEGLGRKYGGSEKVILGTKVLSDPDHPKEKIYDCDPDADKSLERELAEFVRAIKTKTTTTPNATDAYETLKIVEKIYGQQ